MLLLLILLDVACLRRDQSCLFLVTEGIPSVSTCNGSFWQSWRLPVFLDLA